MSHYMIVKSWCVTSHDKSYDKCGKVHKLYSNCISSIQEIEENSIKFSLSTWTWSVIKLSQAKSLYPHCKKYIWVKKNATKSYLIDYKCLLCIIIREGWDYCRSHPYCPLSLEAQWPPPPLLHWKGAKGNCILRQTRIYGTSSQLYTKGLRENN